VESINGDVLYKLVLGLIVPRPIGWISTSSSEGIYNIAPFSFFNAVCDEPPVFIISEHLSVFLMRFVMNLRFS